MCSNGVDCLTNKTNAQEQTNFCNSKNEQMVIERKLPINQFTFPKTTRFVNATKNNFTKASTERHRFLLEIYNI